MALNKKFKMSPHFFSCLRFFCLLSMVYSLWSILSGCIRLAGTAGYWKQGPNEEAPQAKQVHFDSNDLVYPDRPKGNITT